MSIAREYAGLVEDAAVREPIFAQVERRIPAHLRDGAARLRGACIAERFPQFRAPPRAPPEDHQPGEPRTGASVARAPQQGSEEMRTALLLSINCAAAGLGATG